ncbi:MAG: hypothetical protein R3244_00485 [Thermoanaerobaculia bacterium]|nr:hypothetical protein [Thermoanaerobaculia bacterium]
MQSEESRRITGWFFVVGAVLLWAGWWLLPVRIGTFFVAGDFAAVHDAWHQFVWVYRAHIFGLVIGIMGFAALAALDSEDEIRVFLWPGAAVAALGLAVGALGEAFYYHHGAWGALQLDEAPANVVATYVQGLRLDTEYVTCLVRFSRVFFGLGQLVLAAAFLKWRLVPSVLGWAAVVLGVAAMLLTMAFGDNLEYYRPVFHLNAAWLAALGGVMLRRRP